MLGEVWVQCKFCNVIFEKREGNRMGKMICPRCKMRLSLKEMNDIRCRSCSRRTITVETECPWCKEKKEQLQKQQNQPMQPQNDNNIRLMKDRTERRWLVYRPLSGKIFYAKSAVIVGEGEAACCKMSGKTRWLEVPGLYSLAQIWKEEMQNPILPEIIELDEPILFFDTGLHEHSWHYSGTTIQIHKKWMLPITISYQYMLDYKLLVQYSETIQEFENCTTAEEQLKYLENWLKKEIDELILETAESFFYCMYEDEMTITEIKQDLSAFNTRDIFEKNILFLVKEQLENRNLWIQLVQLTIRYGSQELTPIESL